MLYDRFVRPLLFRMNPERVHHLTLTLLADTPASALLRMKTFRAGSSAYLLRSSSSLSAAFFERSIATSASSVGRKKSNVEPSPARTERAREGKSPNVTAPALDSTATRLS